MLKFFLAYGYDTEGEKLAQQIETDLTNLKVKIVDGKMIGTGNLNQAIKARIRSCDALISILTEREDNDFVYSEMYYADGRDKDIIIIKGDVKELKKGLLADQAYIQLPKRNDELKLELAAAVKTIKKNIRLKKPPDDKKSGKAFNEFLTVGMEKVYDRLTHEDIKFLMGVSKRIKVLKEWFPESDEIAKGLKAAIENSTIEDPATIELLLCKPGSVILNERSLGAHEVERHGGFTVYNAVLNVYNWLLLMKPPHGTVHIALYDSWPGCPVIWYDDVILMGFYFRGASSPDWPWVRVKKESKLSTILGDQFNELLYHDKTQHLDTLEQMKDWLKKNKKWARLES